MSNPVKVSAVLIVKNEKRNIVEALTSLHGWADEIVIVDDHSTDETVELARRFTDRIFTHKMVMEGVQRNFGVSKAQNDWIMFIDGDERMTPELQKEITEMLANHDGKTFAYWCPRKNYLGDVWLQHGGWYPAPHIKLYHKNYLKWKEIPSDVVHPGIELAPGAQGGRLKNHLIHYNFRNIEDFMAKTNRQTTLEAIKWHLQGKKISMAHAFWKSFDRFFRRFVRDAGYKDGYYGFVAAFLSGFYQFAAYSKLREIQEKGYYLDQYAPNAPKPEASTSKAS